jgi:hypothetical protein
VPSVSLLRALFYPQVRAAAQFEAELTATPYELSKDGMTTYEARVRVRNAGNGTARDGFLIVETNAGPERPVGFQQTDSWSVMFRDINVRHFAARLPIHPSSVVDVFRLVWRTPGRSRGGWGLASGGKDFTLQFRFFADNQEPQASKLTVDLSRLTAWVSRNCTSQNLSHSAKCMSHERSRPAVGRPLTCGRHGCGDWSRAPAARPF